MRVPFLVIGLTFFTFACPDEPPPQLLKEYTGKPAVPGKAPAPARAPTAAVESAPKPTPAPPPRERKLLFDFAAASATDAWVAGEGGQALHWDGQRWSPTQTGTVERLAGLVAFPGEAWACGMNGALHWTAGAWTPVASGSPAPCFAAWGASPDDVWFVGATLQHWDGKALSLVAWPWGDWGDFYFQLDGRARDDLWAVGRDQSGGLVSAHFDGHGWTRQAFAFRGQVASLAVLDSGEVWLSTETALLHRTARGAWEPAASPATHLGQLGRGPGGLWLVDSEAALFKLEGTAFVRQLDRLPSQTFAVWPAAVDDVWLAGEDLGRFDGKTVQAVTH